MAIERPGRRYFFAGGGAAMGLPAGGPGSADGLAPAVPAPAGAGMSPQPASLSSLNFHLPSLSVSTDIDAHFPFVLPMVMLFCSTETASVSDRNVGVCLFDIFM